MKRGFSALLALALLALGASVSLSVDHLAQPAPTLVPPTLVPTQDSGVFDALPSESTIARILREGQVRVGLLYNFPPFGELSVRGEVVGFDADLARSMAETWGVTFVPVQVTRQTALTMLRSGDVDLLVAAQVHRRELDSWVEFSQTYYPGTQSMLVRDGDAAQSLADMANRRVGVVMGRDSVGAVADWQTRTGVVITVQQYLTLDQALVALVAGEVDGLVDNRVQLARLVGQQGIARFLEEPVAPEPYAIVVRRQDVNFRNLVNRTLQYLLRSGRINEIHRTHFNAANFPVDGLTVWAGLPDAAPKPDQFPADVSFPAQYALPRVQAAGVIRVAGVTDLPPDAPESERRLDAFNRAVIELLTARWGWRVEYIPDSVANAADLVAGGQADLALGVPLNWSVTDRVDLTGYYLLHGERLMSEVDRDYETFRALLGRWVGVFASEPGAAERVDAITDTINVTVRIYTINREQDAAFVMLDENNADAVFGDSLKLIPHVQANPDVLKLTRRGDAPDPWYSRTYVAMAVPRNDPDFRLLVEYTLQEIARDGSLRGLLAPVMLEEDIPLFEVWPGPSDYLGISLSS